MAESRWRCYMPHRELAQKKARKRVLIIHHNARLRSDLAGGWVEAGWEAFQAEGREDGMKLMYQIHPDLINLEVTEGAENNWDALQSIRHFTTTPVVVLADQPTPAGEKRFENSQIVVVNAPVSVRKLVSTSKSFWKFVYESSAPPEEPIKEEPAN